MWLNIKQYKFILAHTFYVNRYEKCGEYNLGIIYSNTMKYILTHTHTKYISMLFIKDHGCGE